MANTNAYTYLIGPSSSDKSESYLVHQQSPSWVLTFIRWNVRDTIRAFGGTSDSSSLLSVRRPLVVENDCIQLSVVVNKSVLTHSMNAVLVETDVNYATAIAPGDFVFVNMLSWESDARRVAIAASNLNPINNVADGFKGVFKIQSVRKTIEVDPSSGVKRVLVKITGFSFTEFNNMIYYNPMLARENQGTPKDDQLFPTNLQSDYAQLISPDNNPSCQDLIKALIQAFIGVGVSDRGTQSVGDLPITPNTHFYIPSQIGSLLGLPSVKAAKDVYNFIFGLQTYGSASNATLASGFNPSNLTLQSNPQSGNSSNPDSALISPDRFYYTNTPCPGNTLLKAEYWNQVNAWSIINQYTNAPLNELYSCFRISPSGKVMPTIVFRQIPFTSEYFGTAPFTINTNIQTSLGTAQYNGGATVTKFLSLPRWKIGLSTIFAVDLGRDEAARVNFVQHYSLPTSDVSKSAGYLSAQTAAKNFEYDVNDVLRSGLRPVVINSAFASLATDNVAVLSRIWAVILADAYIGGHLKLNGTIQSMGIQEPIAVGDNLEFDGAVYHLEEITHICSISPENGVKTFRTNVKISNGVSIANSQTGLSYPEMTHTSGYQDRNADYSNGYQILPGVSEEQDVRYRANNPSPAPTLTEINANDRPFAQPGQTIKPVKDSDNENQ